jgi:hypothetical protein
MMKVRLVLSSRHVDNSHLFTNPIKHHRWPILLLNSVLNFFSDKGPPTTTIILSIYGYVMQIHSFHNNSTLAIQLPFDSYPHSIQL